MAFAFNNHGREKHVSNLQRRQSTIWSRQVVQIDQIVQSFELMSLRNDEFVDVLKNDELGGMTVSIQAVVDGGGLAEIMHDGIGFLHVQRYRPLDELNDTLGLVVLE